MNEMKPVLVAPCGMNCNLCSRYLDPSKVPYPNCPGCRPRGRGCIHKRGLCKKLRKAELAFCYECEDYPCEDLKALDKKYQKNYNCSFIEHLDYIKKHGIEEFLKIEKEKYKCPNCGHYICVHNGKCYNCNMKLQGDQ